MKQGEGTVIDEYAAAVTWAKGKQISSRYE